MQNLKVVLVQCNLVWEQPEDNQRQIGDIINALERPTDLIVLPEMFTTGFSMNALANAEPAGGPTHQWLQAMAQQHQCAITGSIAVREGDTVYNRMLFATPHGVEHYDKRHLFGFAGEHRRYGAGSDRVIVKWRGWRINLQICYDLRFPVFSRNRGDYDLLLYVANWPDTRSYHWRQLLLARAIENQACVVGVNRVGEDANGLRYSGDSLVIAGDGEVLLDLRDSNGAAGAVLVGEDLKGYRKKFSFQADADDYTLTE